MDLYLRTQFRRISFCLVFSYHIYNYSWCYTLRMVTYLLYGNKPMVTAPFLTWYDLYFFPKTGLHYMLMGSFPILYIHSIYDLYCFPRRRLHYMLMDFFYLFIRNYGNCGLLEHALLYNPAYIISCVVQPLQIQYMPVSRVGRSGVHPIFYFFHCFEYNGIVMFIWKSFKSNHNILSYFSWNVTPLTR